MLEEYTKELVELTEWYAKTKELVIRVESLDSKSYIQPLHELRYSYDHLMRAVIYEQNSDVPDKIKKAILSAKGHLVRAYSDCVEWLLVTVKDEYNRILRPQKMAFSLSEILEIMPEYLQIREQLQTLTDVVDSYKTNKRSEEDNNFNPIDELQNPLIKALCGEDGFFDGKYTDLLREYYDKIHSLEAKFASLKRRKFTTATLKNIVIPIVTGIIGGLIVYLITK